MTCFLSKQLLLLLIKLHLRFGLLLAVTLSGQLRKHKYQGVLIFKNAFLFESESKTSIFVKDSDKSLPSQFASIRFTLFLHYILYFSFIEALLIKVFEERNKLVYFCLEVRLCVIHQANLLLPELMLHFS